MAGVAALGKSRLAVTTACAVAILAAGCSAAQTPASTATGSSAASRPMPPGCTADLAAIPSNPPATAQQAADDSTMLAGRTGNEAASLTDAVAADAMNISFDIDVEGSTTIDTAKWNTDVAVLRAYCAGKPAALGLPWS